MQRLGMSTSRQLARVVIASSMGTVFEWYDFFLFGTLASMIARNFTGGGDGAGFIFALGAFAAGFIMRPFGALFFGSMGDRVGRKKTFLVTISLMGGSTVALGLLPNVSQVGIAAPILLVLTRVLQGFAMGGEYGGAAVYVAEHAESHRRGYLTSWIQATAAAGLVLALAVVLATRVLLGEGAMEKWGWRLPFLFSAFLLALSLWIRVRLSESPVFRRMSAARQLARSPIAAAFQGENLRRILLALVCILLAQGAVWYTGHFYAPFFLERILKMSGPTVNLLMVSAVVLSAGAYVFFGWLSDRVGRKPVMLIGMAVAALSYWPGFHALAASANPKLVAATERAPVVVLADPADCHFQFDLLGRGGFGTSCDVAQRILTDAGIPYQNVTAAKGAVAQVGIDARFVRSVSVVGSDAVTASTMRQRVATDIRSLLEGAGYPIQGAGDEASKKGVLLWLLVFLLAAAALYGPQAAALVELFPANVRYTALSVPYNIGTGWIGGLLPVSAFAMVAAKGDIYCGLWYPFVFTTIGIAATILFFPETNGRSLEVQGCHA
jgi:MFS family permease